jgi:hypothetical protein
MYAFRTHCEPYPDDAISETENFIGVAPLLCYGTRLTPLINIACTAKVTSFTTIAIPKGTTLEVL